MAQNEIALLFEKDRKTIAKHIKNILEELELDSLQVCSKKEHTANDGNKYLVNIYNLDMIIDNKKLFHLGHSIKDLGKKISSISELETNLIQSLLESIK